jgi:hypothetical protein
MPEKNKARPRRAGCPQQYSKLPAERMHRRNKEHVFQLIQKIIDKK